MFQELLYSVFVSRLCFVVFSAITLIILFIIIKRPTIDKLPIILAVGCIFVMSIISSGKSYVAYKTPSIIVEDDVACTYLSWSWADEISFETNNGDQIKLHRPSKRYLDVINVSLEEGHRYNISYEEHTNILLSVDQV